MINNTYSWTSCIDQVEISNLLQVWAVWWIWLGTTSQGKKEKFRIRIHKSMRHIISCHPCMMPAPPISLSCCSLRLVMQLIFHLITVNDTILAFSAVSVGGTKYLWFLFEFFFIGDMHPSTILQSTAVFLLIVMDLTITVAQYGNVRGILWPYDPVSAPSELCTRSRD